MAKATQGGCTTTPMIVKFKDGRTTAIPRGYVVKLHLPSGKHNTWGGKESGYGIG